MAAMAKPNRPNDIPLPTNGVPTGGSDAAVTAMAKGAPNVITYGTRCPFEKVERLWNTVLLTLVAFRGVTNLYPS